MEVDQKKNTEYTNAMRRTNKATHLNELIEPLGDCLNPEAARRLIKLKTSAKLQARMTQLADLHSEGRLSPEEQLEYRNYVSYGTVIAVLKSKARQLLAQSNGA